MLKDKNQKKKRKILLRQKKNPNNLHVLKVGFYCCQAKSILLGYGKENRNHTMKFECLPTLKHECVSSDVAKEN